MLNLIYNKFFRRNKNKLQSNLKIKIIRTRFILYIGHRIYELV